ncbi:MAG TPA: 5'-3' exonuclease H3TH domain-containing protein [Thermoanaerobaculia bacterium]|nr:5'-3' exonuclease H3TH domain-containing protein [Thermoanaerobaculia bacterium]
MTEPAYRPVVHLVDASPYIFRAHFSLPGSIKTPQGAPAAATYGFASFLLKLVADERPTHLAVAFDRNLNGSFRNAEYPEYKAQRQDPPPELVAQIDTCLEVAAALGAATFIDESYEADDLIATLLARLTPRGHGAVVVTSDKDLAQLVSDRVSLLDFAQEMRYTPATIQEKFGVRPDQITDLLGLAGDPVDNIPGVPGIGRKTAAELLAAYGHLEDVYAHLDEIPFSKIRAAKSVSFKLREHRDLAVLSKRLATVATDAPIPRNVGLKELSYRGADRAVVEPLFDRLGFKKIKERI